MTHLFGLSFLSLPAFGHPMSVTRGTAFVEDNDLTLSLEIHAVELLHTRKLSPNADGLYAIEDVRRAADAHGRALQQRIVIRDARGEEIDPGAPVLESCKLDQNGGRGLSLDDLRQLHVRYSLKYILGRANEYLSFQQVAGGSDMVLPSTIVLSVRADDPGAPRLRTVRLTRGGNVEVVRLASEEVGSAVEESGCHIRRFAQFESQRTVRAIVRIHDAGLRLDVFMPVRILETWTPLARSRRDFLDGEEQTRCHAELARFIAGNNPVSIDGHHVEGRLAGVEFLDVGEFGGNAERTPRRLSAWTSRVRFTMEYDSPSRPGSVDLQWTLFNASILAAHALIVVDEDSLERDLSTYDPHLRWTAD